MDENNLEAQSYSKSSYRLVQKVRAQGAEYGIDVPYLQYPLPAARSTGWALKAMLILSALLVAAGIGLLLWALIQLFIPAISHVGSIELTEMMQTLPLLNLLGSVSVIILWLIVCLIPALGLAMALGGLLYLLTLLRICRLSMPEKAVGFYLGSVKKTALIYALLSTAVTIALFILIPTVVVGIIGAIITIYLWALFAVLQIERNRALVAFKELPAEQQADFTAHSQALKLAHSRRQARKASQVITASHKGKWGVIMALFDDFSDARIVYNNLRDNDAVRPTATGLARRAFGQLLNFTIATLALLGVIYGLMVAFADSTLLKVIFLIFAVFVALYGVLVIIPIILNFTVKQLKLNRHPLGWVALLLTLLALVVAVVLVMLIFGTMSA